MTDPHGPGGIRAGAESGEQFLAPDDEVVTSEDGRDEDLPDGGVL